MPGENDLHEPRGDNYGYNEGTICLVSALIVGKGMVFRAWAHKRTPLSGWYSGLVVPIFSIVGLLILHG